jgi:Cd2+/Zn2+-exporting ATPase
MKRYGISADVPDRTGTVVHVAADRQYAGYIVIADTVKEDSARAIADLRKLGVGNLVMLTGDNRETGEKIGRELGLDDVKSGLLPHQKVEAFENLIAQGKSGGRTVFVGDGMNDAPVLRRADVGIAMGGLGSDAAIEAADVVIMTDEPSKVATALRISAYTRKIVTENIVFALGVKIIILLLAVFGLANMWWPCLRMSA